MYMELNLLLLVDSEKEVWDKTALTNAWWFSDRVAGGIAEKMQILEPENG